MATVLITGGTGLIGSALTNELLNRNYDVIILTRSPEKYPGTTRLSYAKWDTEKQTIDGDAFIKADHIIHLAGEGVADKRWTTKRKRQIAE
jgi:NAD dependent epimerase/dehydratase family enzyme